LTVNKEVLNLDKNLRALSNEALFALRPKIQNWREPQEVKIMKNKKTVVSTYDQTKMLVDKKLSLAEIARRRGLREETIIGHLEKLTRKEKMNLNYLKLPKVRVQDIKSAFLQAKGWNLSPAREILGEDFSYLELRLGRLFLMQPK